MAISASDIERARAFKTIRSIWDEKPPVRIAICALLQAGYSHRQAERMMWQHYDLPEIEYRRNVKVYNLRDLEGHKL